MSALLRQIVSEGLLYVANHIVSRIPSHWIRLLFYRSAMGFEIGRHSYIYMDAWFDSRHGFKLGHHTIVHSACKFDTGGGIVIGNNVSIAPLVCILTADNDTQSSAFGGRESPVRIEDYACIGTRAVILRGVTVGRGAIVSEGSVVMLSVPPFTVVAGSPARPVAKRSRNLDYELDGYKLFC